MQIKLNPEVFRLAAKMMTQSDFNCGCCKTLHQSYMSIKKPYEFFFYYKCFFEKILGENQDLKSHWYGNLFNRDNKNARIFGLILCSILIKEGYGIEYKEYDLCVSCKKHILFY